MKQKTNKDKKTKPVKKRSTRTKIRKLKVVKKTSTISKKKVKATNKKAIVKKIVIKKPRQKKNVSADFIVKSANVTSIVCEKRQTEPQIKKSHKQFSFPIALTQVRGVVRSNRISNNIIKPFSPVELKIEKPNQLLLKQKKLEYSPYVLDLKRKVSFNNVLHHQVIEKPKKVQSESNDEIVSLFNSPESINLGARLAQGVKAIKRDLTSTKRINLTPSEKKFEPQKAWYSFKKRSAFHWGYLISEHRLFSYLGRLFKKPQANSSFELDQRLNEIVHNKSIKEGKPVKASRFVSILASRSKVKNQPCTPDTISEVLHKKRSFFPKREVLTITFKRAFAPFAVMVVLLLMPFLSLSLLDYAKVTEGKVFGATDNAVRQLQDAQLKAKQLDFIEASKKFEQAGQAFLAAGKTLDDQLGVASKFVSFVPMIGDKVETAYSLLEAGNQLALAATSISQGVAVFTDDGHFLANEEASHKLEYLLVHWQDANPYIITANKSLSRVDLDVVPEDVRSEVLALKELLPELQNYVKDMDDLMDPLLAFLGHDSLQRYLVLFQNNTELRATGGFLGSLALVDIDRGELKGIEIPGGGPYDFQGSLFENYQAPRALQLINPRLELQDANWFFDWPTSARKVANLYEKAGGPSVDGVIAINTNVLEKFLEFTGAIYLEKYDREISAENFREVMQSYVEFEYDKELNQPKQIISDLAPVLLEKIQNLSPKEYIPIAQMFSSLLQERDIFIYHQNEVVATAFEQFGWAGEVVETDSDYLAVVHTNLAGGKTDGVIDDQFKLNIHIDEKGEITNTLTIRRQHNGVNGVPLIGVRNVDYLRIYTPLGSQLISASGFEQPPVELFERPDSTWKEDLDLKQSQNQYITDPDSQTETYTESNKTVFANWIQVDPGQSVEVKIVYTTPINLMQFQLPEKDSSWSDWVTGDTVQAPEYLRLYRLYWQKQSGVWSPEMAITINYPQDWQIKSESIVSPEYGAGTWSANAIMKGDSLWSLIFY